MGGLDGEVHPKEVSVDRDDGVEDGEPAVEFASQARKVFRGERYDEVDGPEQADEDRHLHDHRAKTAYRVEAHLFVGLHDLLLAQLRVVLVPVVDDPHARTEILHLARLTNLPDDELIRGTADQHRECDDGQAEVAAKDDVQHQKGVGHRFGDHLVPDEDNEIKHLFSVFPA